MKSEVDLASNFVFAASYTSLKARFFGSLARLFINSGTETSSVTLIPPTKSKPNASDLFLTSENVDPIKG